MAVLPLRGRLLGGAAYFVTPVSGPPVAGSYTTSISASSGPNNSTFVFQAIPAAGDVWPTNEAVAVVVTNGTPDASSKVGSGSTPVSFTITANGGSSTICTVKSSAVGMTNLDGDSNYSITAPTTLVANRYDILVNRSSGDTSTVCNVSAVLNGLAGSSGTISLVASKAGGGTSNVGTVSLTSGSASAPPVAWTPPSPGEWTISGTNTIGLHNPWSPLYVAFSASNGTAQSISVNSSYFLDGTPFQQDAWGGTPNGWAAQNGASFGMGWGAFQLKITPGGSSAALYGQLIDSDSSGAGSTGGGTAISNVAQIYGAVAGGSELTLNVNLPTSDYIVYLDVATDSAMANRRRVPLRFEITDVWAFSTRSMECMFGQEFGYSTPPGTTWGSYTKTMFDTSTGPANYANSSWVRADGANSGPVATMEAGRRFFNKKGHGCAIVGMTQNQGAINDHWSETDGSPSFGFQDSISRVNGKFRYLKTLENEWNASYGTPESYAAYQSLIGKIINYMPSHYPALAVIAFGCSSGQFGQDGSRATGYTRINKIITDQIEPINPMVIGADFGPDWNEWGSQTGHASRASQTRFARSAALAVMMAEGAHAGGYGFAQADRLATFPTTGTLSGGTLYVPFTLPSGATSLVAKKWLNGTSAAGWTYSTPSALELCDIVAVYAGSGTHWAGGTPVLITGVVIDNANRRLAITLDRSGGAGTVTYFNNGGTIAQPAQFTVQLFSDFHTNNTMNVAYTSSYCVGIYDDRSSLDDYGWGAHARPQLDIVCS